MGFSVHTAAIELYDVNQNNFRMDSQRIDRKLVNGRHS